MLSPDSESDSESVDISHIYIHQTEFQQYFKEVKRMFRGRFKDVSRQFQGCFKDVLRMF